MVRVPCCWAGFRLHGPFICGTGSFATTSKRALNPRGPWFHSLPMLEGVVHDGLEHQAVPNLGGAPEVEHLNGLQRRVGTAQPAGGGRGWEDRINAPVLQPQAWASLSPCPSHRHSPHVLPSGPPTPTQPGMLLPRGIELKSHFEA